MHVTEATENYLETILILSNRLQEVHAIDICTELGYSRPTVSVFLKGLREKGLIEVDANNHLWLTAAGRAIAEPIYERHTRDLPVHPPLSEYHGITLIFKEDLSCDTLKTCTT